MQSDSNIKDLTTLERNLEKGLLAFQSERDAIMLRGLDIKTWLQGQVTNDVLSTKCWRGNWCKATGQVVGITSGAFLDEKSCIIWGDEQSLQIVLERATKMVILEDVIAEIIRVSCIEIAGKSNTNVLDQLEEIFDENIVFQNQVLCPNSIDIIGYKAGEEFGKNLDTITAILSKLNAPFNVNSYRIKSGTPSILDVEGKTLPPEFGTAYESQTIHYNKGCYMGQEVLMRIYSQGHTNRIWRACSWQDSVTKGDEILDNNGKKIGNITSVANSPSWGWLSGVMLHKSADDSASLITQRGIIGQVISTKDLVTGDI